MNRGTIILSYCLLQCAPVFFFLSSEQPPVLKFNLSFYVLERVDHETVCTLLDYFNAAH